MTCAIHDYVNTIPLIKEVLCVIMLILHLWSSSQTRLTVSSPQGVPFHRWNQFQPSLHSPSTNQFGFTIILNEPNSSKKVRDTSLQDLSNIFTFMFRFDNQLWLKSWLWRTKVKLHKESRLTRYIPCEVSTPYIDTRISWEPESWWTKGDTPREILIYLTNSPRSLDLTL